MNFPLKLGCLKPILERNIHKPHNHCIRLSVDLKDIDRKKSLFLFYMSLQKLRKIILSLKDISFH